jgi:hypothetical protein
MLPPLYYQVQSSRDRATYYRVQGRPVHKGHNWACNCPARGRCWHIVYCRTLLNCGVAPIQGQVLKLECPPFLAWLKDQGRALYGTAPP